MAENNLTVFSEFEARDMRCIFADGDVYDVKCVSKVEHKANVREVSKKCRGIVSKKTTRGTGDGTLKVTAHIPHEMLVRIHGRDLQTDLVDGVTAYGQSSIHPEVTFTADIFDEDDNEKMAAWPRCVASAGPSSTIENGGDTVEEVELEISYMPDDYNNGYYEALAADLSTTIKAAWLNTFTTDLVHTTTTA